MNKENLTAYEVVTEENLFSFIDIRIKYRIQINMHQILKILIIAAGYRIAGFIRISHGIQELSSGTEGRTAEI